MTPAEKLRAQQDAVNAVSLAVRAERLSAREHECRAQEVLESVLRAKQLGVKMSDLTDLTQSSRSGLSAKLKKIRASQETEGLDQ